MSLPGSWPEHGNTLVSDASVWINLVATEQAELILRSSNARHLITATARAELEAGRAKGRLTAEAVAGFLADGLVEEVRLESLEEEEIFVRLVAGPVRDTLDDGEAATIAFALANAASALIDERKATMLCSRQFPDLQVVNTVDLLLCRPVRQNLTDAALGDAIFNALERARMRVPDDHQAEVRRLIGAERALRCPSLPQVWRNPVLDASNG